MAVKIENLQSDKETYLWGEVERLKGEGSLKDDEIGELKQSNEGLGR